MSQTYPNMKELTKAREAEQILRRALDRVKSIEGQTKGADAELWKAERMPLEKRWEKAHHAYAELRTNSASDYRLGSPGSGRPTHQIREPLKTIEKDIDRNIPLDEKKIKYESDVLFNRAQDNVDQRSREGAGRQGDTKRGPVRKGNRHGDGDPRRPTKGERREQRHKPGRHGALEDQESPVVLASIDASLAEALSVAPSQTPVAKGAPIKKIVLE